MKGEYIHPFIKSIDNAMKTIMNLAPERSASYINKGCLPPAMFPVSSGWPIKIDGLPFAMETCMKIKDGNGGNGE
ncbi:MAG: hypothetical protein JSU85_07645 [Candidatus Zixiibacteriota bacterium]|nr:MAG: hypothetical protein JSU85_07645 [candidate division Zixibacteria bacterium]